MPTAVPVNALLHQGVFVVAPAVIAVALLGSFAAAAAPIPSGQVPAQHAPSRPVLVGIARGFNPLGAVIGALVAVAVLVLASPIRALLTSALGLVLLALAAVDIRTLRIPDIANAMVAGLGLALSGLNGPGSLLVGAVSGVVAWLVLEGFRRGYLILRRRPGLGQGDVKLLAALGVWLGFATPWCLALAAAFGLVWAVATRQGGRRFAFGPFLAAAGWVVGFALELAPGGIWP